MTTRTMLRAALASVAAFTCAFVGFASSATAAGKPIGYVPANVRVANAVKAFQQHHETDYVGLNQAVVRAGGSPLRFDFPEAGLYQLSPEDAQAAYVEARAAERSGGVSTMAALPADTFEISGYWSHSQDQYGEWWTFFGSWDFNNAYSYGSGGEPYDVMAVQTKDLVPSCWAVDGDGIWSFNQAGSQETSSLFITRRASDYDTTVWQLEDFHLESDAWYVDRGSGYISYKNSLNCSPKVIYGKAFYEHNDEGCNCSWSVGVNHLGMNVTYSGTIPKSILQKSTPMISTWTDNESPCTCGGGGGGGGGQPTLKPFLDVNHDGKPDVLGVNTVGDMHRWYGDGAGFINHGAVIGRGWNSYEQYRGPGDINSDGKTDLIAVDKNTGDMHRWHGDGYGLVYAGVIGGGWNNYIVIAGRDINRDGKPDLLGIHKSTGDMHRWYGNGVSFDYGGVIGGGWNNYDVIAPGDINSDGKADLLAIHKSTGDLHRFYGNGSGSYTHGGVLGGGWQNYTIIAAGDMNSDAKPDIVGIQKSTGDMHRFYGDGAGWVNHAGVIGGGWQNYVLVG